MFFFHQILEESGSLRGDRRVHVLIELIGDFKLFISAFLILAPCYLDIPFQTDCQIAVELRGAAPLVSASYDSDEPFIDSVTEHGR
jgi:hypothetical protein